MKQFLQSGESISIGINGAHVSSDGFYPQSIYLKIDNDASDNQIFSLFLVDWNKERFKIALERRSIMYQEDIVIKHNRSNKYISCISDGEKKTISLQTVADNNCLFQILPCYQSQVQNDKSINLQEDILIAFSPQNIANISDFTEQEDQSELFLNLTSYGKAMTKNRMKTQKAQNQLGFIHQDCFMISKDNNSIFQLFREAYPNLDDIVKKPILKYGSIIEINLIQHKCQLEVLTGEEIALVRQGHTDPKQTDLESLCKLALAQTKTIRFRHKEAQHDKLFFSPFGVHSLWVCYNLNKAGLEIHQKHPFYLKHLQSGQYLDEQGCLTDNYLEAMQLYFENDGQPDQEIVETGLYYLKQYKDNKVISPIIERMNNSSKLIDTIYQIGLQDNQNQNYLLQLKNADKNIAINKYEKFYEWIESTRAWLKRTTKYLSEMNQELLQIMNQGKKIEEYFDQEEQQNIFTMFEILQQCLKDLTLYNTTCEEFPGEINKVLISHLEPNLANQNILRQMEIAPLIIDLISSLPWNHDIAQLFSNTQTYQRYGTEIIQQSQTTMIQNSIVNMGEALTLSVRDTLNLCFYFFQTFANSNEINGLMVFSLYFKLNKYLGLQIGGFQCLMKVFQTNQGLVPFATTLKYMSQQQNKQTDVNLKRHSRIKGIQKEQIKLDQDFTFIDQILSIQISAFKAFGIVYWANMLRFCDTICISKGNAVYSNQIVLKSKLEKDLANEQTSQLNNIPVLKFVQLKSLPSGEIVALLNQDQYEINQLYEQIRKGNEGINKYILRFQCYLDAQLSLISTLCYQRNYENIQIFSPLLSKQNLLKYLQKKDLNQMLRGKLINILMNIYVEVFPFFEKPKPNLLIHLQQYFPKQTQLEIKQDGTEMVDLNAKSSIQFINPQRQYIRHFQELIEFNCNFIQTEILQQNQVQLNYCNQYMIQMLYKMMSIGLLKGQNDSPTNIMDSVRSILMDLPGSLRESEPSFELPQEFNSFQQDKQYFNQIAISLLSILELGNAENQSLDLQRLLKYFLNEQQNAHNDKLNKIHRQPLKLSNSKLDEELFNLLIHKQCTQQTQLKCLNLFIAQNSKLRANIKTMKRFLFILNEQDITTMKSIRRIKKSLRELESTSDRIALFPQCITDLNYIRSILSNDNDISVKGQVFLRTMDVDVLLLDFLGGLIGQIDEITCKFRRELKESNYILALADEDQYFISFCKECFVILQGFMANNTKNKYRILKRIDVLQQYIRCIDVGQFQCLSFIYQNSYLITNQVSKSLIATIMDNYNLNSMIILDQIIYQEGKYCHRNMNEIVKQLYNPEIFEKFIGMKQVQKDGSINIPECSDQTLKLLGVTPYLLQSKGLNFLTRLYQQSDSTASITKVIYDYLTPGHLIRLLNQSKDVFNFNGDTSIVIMQTILKAQIIKLLICIMQHKSNVILDDIFQQEFEKMLSNLLKFVKTDHQDIQTMNQCSTQNGVTAFTNLNSYFSNSKIQQSNNNDDDGSQYSEEEEDNNLHKAICINALNIYACDLSFTTYVIMVFELHLQVISQLLEQIAHIEEQSQQSQVRKVSIVSRQLSLSQPRQSEKVSGEENSTNVILQLFQKLSESAQIQLKPVEDYLKLNLSQSEYNLNKKRIIQCQNQYYLIHQRKLEFANCQTQLILEKEKVETFHTPEYIYDKRVIDLVKIEKQSNQEHQCHQLQILMSYREEIQEERIYFLYQLQQLLQKQTIIDANGVFINVLLQSLSYALLNVQQYYDNIKYILELLSHMIDTSGVLSDSLSQTTDQFSKIQKGIFSSKNQESIFKKDLKAIQNLLIDKGFITIFIKFTHNFNNMQQDCHQELQENFNHKLHKIYTKMIWIVFKLVKGCDSANSFVQNALYNEIINTNNNDLIGWLHHGILKKVQQKQRDLIGNQTQSDMESVLFAYEFNQYNILQEKYMELDDLLVKLKFIQILVEDHNRAFQDFFREQIGFQQQYDIVDALLQLLEKYFPTEILGKFSENDYKIIVGCFECLKELIQGPCPQNQVKICSARFLTVANRILSYEDSHNYFLEHYSMLSYDYLPIDKNIHDDNRMQNISRSRQVTVLQNNQQNSMIEQSSVQQRIVQYYSEIPLYCKSIINKFKSSNPQNFKVYMLSEIKNRCATTLESLTDSDNDENQMLQIIQKYIPEQLLIDNLADIYLKFKILYVSGKNYSNDVFTHSTTNYPYYRVAKNYSNMYLQVHDEVNKSLGIQDFWKSFLIETGFSLYNLLAQIYIIKQTDVLERIQEQIQIRNSKRKRIRANFLIQIVQFFFQATTLSKDLIQKNQGMLDKRILTQFYLSKAPKEIDSYRKKVGYRALRFFTTRTGTVEVLLKNKILKRIVFPLMPHCFVLNETIKAELMNSIDTLSPQTKVESILLSSKYTIDHLKMEYEFLINYRNNIIVNLFASNQPLWKQVIFIIILLENFFILVTSNGGHDVFYDKIVLGLNYSQISLQCICFLIFIIKKAPYLIQQSEEEVYQRQLQRIKNREIKYRYTGNTRSIVQQEDFILENTDAILLEQNKYQRLYHSITDGLLVYKHILLDGEMIYFLIFTTIAIVGLFYRIVLAALLLDVFWRFPTLTSVVNAIWRPRAQIMLALALFMIMQYYYTLIMYNYFKDSYQPMCQHLNQCFAFILDVTLKTNGGILGYSLSTKYQTTLYENGYGPSVRSAIEFTYVFVVISLLFSIITGIIIDTFGLLREEAQLKQEGLSGFCLVCGIDRATIQKKAKHQKGFNFHIKYEHNVWNYIFYIAYLSDKKVSDQNGIETDISDSLTFESIYWFPTNKAISIPDEPNEIDEFNRLRQFLDHKFDALLKKLSDVRKRQFDKQLQNVQ